MQDNFMDTTPLEERQEPEVEKFPAEKWIDISEGMEIDDSYGEKQRLQIPYDERSKMTYDSNNGVIAFVDGEGRMRVAPATSDRYSALEEAGYSRGGIGVPFSNGDMPTDPTLRRQWEEMRETAREQNLKERIESHLGYFKAEAEKKQIKQEVAGEWLTVDGVEIEMMGTKSIIERNTDGYNMAVGRLEQVGTYDSNNGVIAFVDGEGRMRVAPATSDRYSALRAAGYRRGGIGVPFSNGDMPTDPALCGQWEKMRDEARQDR